MKVISTNRITKKQYIIKLFLISLFLCSCNSFAQKNTGNIFSYEKEIAESENYEQVEITFRNHIEDINLYGTLIKPSKTKFEKMIIIVPGSGLDTRNNHFLLTEYFLSKNIAVFRYDERGVNMSEGNNSNVTYGVTEMTEDLISSVEVLNEKFKDKNIKLGLLGHSLGGLATINAVKKIPEIDFIVQWAVPIQNYGEFFKYQIRTGVDTFESELIFEDKEKKIEIISAIQDVVSKNPELDDLKLSKKLKKVTRKHGYKRKNYDRFTVWTFPSRKDLFRQNNEATYQNLTIPMLYIIGSDDKFVDPRSNTELLKNFNNKMISTSIMSGLNHYLTDQEIEHYQMSKSLYNIDKKAVNTIIDWIQSL
ncbi:alpha/beta hydrolase family protein [Christiangramia sp. LLG6405-1]|uniref:alpha/beta hydrolase family protein n=1 Tax=Christiangramia sp. LLG6405-1 TaxID=3160832 RepID=UPI0038664E6B